MDFTLGINAFKDVKERLENISIEGVKWGDLKRVPQTFKRKVKIGNFTCDEEFDVLHRDLGVAEAQLKHLIRASKTTAEETSKQMEISLNIARLFSTLLDPYNNFSQRARDELKSKSLEILLDTLFKTPDEVEQFFLEYEFWKKTDDYIEILQQSKVFVTNIAVFSNVVELRCNACLKLIDNIKQGIRLRNVALDDYDLINSRLMELVRLENARALTAKESELHFNLQRKLDYCRNQYNSINSHFLEQLPCFLDYVKDFLAPVFEMMLFSLLSTNYQILSEFLKLQNKFGFELETINSYSWNDDLMRLSNENINEAVERINKLNILDFTTSYYKSILEPGESKTRPRQPYKVFNNLYKALYHFDAQREGDISFETGDIIKVHKAEGEWWEGEVHGQIGLFPFNYVEMQKNHILNSS